MLEYAMSGVYAAVWAVSFTVTVLLMFALLGLLARLLK